MENKTVTRDVNFYYGKFHALKNISIDHPQGRGGKSTFLRLFNRMNDLIPATRLEGQILMDGNGIYDKKVDVDALRRTRRACVCVLRCRRCSENSRGRGITPTISRSRQSTI